MKLESRRAGRATCLRLVLKWSIALTFVMAVWVTLQAYVLRFLIP